MYKCLGWSRMLNINIIKFTTMKTKKAYIFDPLKHGFEPLSKFPELGFYFPNISSGVWFIKITTYANYGDLVYWYSALSIAKRNIGDDRIEIISGSLDFRKPLDYDKQNKSRVEYLGLITSDEYAKLLFPHLFGTIKNSSVENEGLERYNDNTGKRMREEFPQHYATKLIENK